jgi:hypothetical protein
MDEAGGHAGCPWRSVIRREGFEHVKGARHPSYADAVRRILEVYQAHPAYVEAGRFTLAAGKHVSAEQLARLVAAARADAGRCPAPVAATAAVAAPAAGTRGGGCKRRDRTAHTSGRIAPPWQGRRRWDGLCARGAYLARRYGAWLAHACTWRSCRCCCRNRGEQRSRKAA